MLDPGHGGDDPGAINDAAGLVERELVLDIARRTKALLEEAGYSAALTRNDNATGYANTPRGVIANACHAFVYVSIHLNSFDEPEPNYAKTFWGIEEKDAAFASVMQAALVYPAATGNRPGRLRTRGAGERRSADRAHAGGAGRAGLSLQSGGGRAARRPGWRATRGDCRGGSRWRRRLAALEAAGAARCRRCSWSHARAGDDRGGSPARGAPRIGGAGAGVGAQAEATRPEELRAYVMEVYRLAPLVGIDPAIVVAQSAHETGWWQSPAWTDHLNPAGIGITGSGRRLTILGER